MKNSKEPETCPCKFCGDETRMTGTKLCDHCYAVSRGIERFIRSPKARKFVLDLLQPKPVDVLQLIELLQEGGNLPDVTLKNASVSDWERILMDAHSDLTRQLCHYMEPDNERQVSRCLDRIEEICRLWRKKGPKE